MGVEARWCEACRWLRSSDKFAREVMSYRMAFGLMFPGQWRGKSNYNPTKGALLKTLLGEQWYERIYDDPKAIWLTPERFKKWKQTPEIVSTVSDNLRYWTQLKPELLNGLSAVGWAKLLQVAYDFDLMDQFKVIWTMCLALPWPPDQRALFFQTY